MFDIVIPVLAFGNVSHMRQRSKLDPVDNLLKAVYSLQGQTLSGYLGFFEGLADMICSYEEKVTAIVEGKRSDGDKARCSRWW
jgi:hypothetical protein